jgi:hypothetical protein
MHVCSDLEAAADTGASSHRVPRTPCVFLAIRRDDALFGTPSPPVQTALMAALPVAMVALPLGGGETVQDGMNFMAALFKEPANAVRMMHRGLSPETRLCCVLALAFLPTALFCARA